MERKKGKRNIFLYHLCVCLIGLIMIYPLLWTVSSSFKKSSTIYQTVTQLIPRNPTTENYVNGWAGFSHTTFGVFIQNTIVVTVVATAGAILSSLMVAYALSRIRFRLRNPLFAMVILTMMLPEQIMMIPQYLWYNKLGWINTYLPLIVPHFFAVSGFFTYVFMNFMNGIPKELTLHYLFKASALTWISQKSTPRNVAFLHKKAKRPNDYIIDYKGKRENNLYHISPGFIQIFTFLSVQLV